MFSLENVKQIYIFLGGGINREGTTLLPHVAYMVYDFFSQGSLVVFEEVACIYFTENLIYRHDFFVVVFLCIGLEQSHVFNEAYGSQTHQFSKSEDDDYTENSSKIQG